MKTKTIAAIGLVVAGCAAAVAFCPALRGPFNRVRNTVNETLEDEFVVDNYKAQAIELAAKGKGICENLRKFMVEKKIAEKKLVAAKEKEEAARRNLIATGTADMTKFNRAKDAYENCKVETANFTTLIGVYDAAIKKLEDALALVEKNIRLCKTNVATLESKKTLVSSLKGVSTVLENISGIGEDTELGYSLEKLDDTILDQSLRIEMLDSDTTAAIGDAQAAEEYLEAVKASGN